MFDMLTSLYSFQSTHWPSSGRHILAQFTPTTINVYQAYKNSIASYAVQHQTLGGPDFSSTRMTWIKPNFAWMMYRSAWATNKNQERILAIELQKTVWDEILLCGVVSSYGQSRAFADRDEWNAQLKKSEVRVQWDPDHGLRGEKLKRRAVQVGVKGEWLDKYLQGIVRIEDITPFVREQGKLVEEGLVNARLFLFMPH
jgi:hypothetical protein